MHVSLAQIRPQEFSNAEDIAIDEEYDDEVWGDLPVVDDMEIAALAAEAAMEAVNIADGNAAHDKMVSSSEVPHHDLLPHHL